MKRISFGHGLLFCFAFAVTPMAFAAVAATTVPSAAGTATNMASAETAAIDTQEADMLDNAGQINTDILTPPTIERKLEKKIEMQFKKSPNQATTLPAVPTARKHAVADAPSRTISLPATVVKSKTTQSRYAGFTSVDQKPAFDLPITYNSKVKFWVAYFQGPGQKDFRRYLERSSRYLPKIIQVLDDKGLPRDLAYVAMIESGFSSRAVSTASAVGYWQFIAATANRYGLKTTWWLDERRDITKSTVAAAQYLNDLYRMFNSWYLAAAAYNMGEGRVKRLVEKYQTRNYWTLSQKSDFPHETVNYIPKLMAALLIAKAPAMYGFSDLKLQAPHEYEMFDVPGGTDLENLAYYMGIDVDEMRQLNPELTKGFVPQFISSHRIRVPKGQLAKAHEFIRASL